MFKAPVNKAERLALRKVYIPKGYTPDTRNSEAGEAFVKDGPNGAGVDAFYATAFVGSAGKPTMNYMYRTAAQRDAAVNDFFGGLAAHATYKAEKKAAKAAWTNPLKPGDVLYTSWGYDQTNVDFYAVTRVSGRRTWVRQIAATSEDTGFMSGDTKPVLPIKFLDEAEETMHTAQPSGPSGFGAAIKISNSITAWLAKDPTESHRYSYYA